MLDYYSQRRISAQPTLSVTDLVVQRRSLVIHCRFLILDLTGTEFISGNMRASFSLKAETAASIWFEIWGSWIRDNNISIFLGKFKRNFDLFMQFHQKCRFFQANF